MINNRLTARVTFGILMFLFPFVAKTSSSNLVIYQAPSGYIKSPSYNVTVNGLASPVYDARISDPHNCGYTYFDFEGKVHVTVTVPDGFKSVKIRPQSAGIIPKVRGNKIEFDMISPRKLCIELNGGLTYPLFIFANPIEVNPPKPNDPDVRYFGPGFHDAGKIEMRSNETIYIAGGAVVKGYFTAVNCSNIKILGRGVMDAHENNSTMISMNNCRNIVVDGILIVDQPQMRWTTTYRSCDSALIKNVKIIAGDNVSNDGIGLVSSQHITVDDCFVKCYDDCIVIKAMGTSRRDSKDISILNCLIWNIQAFAIQIGPELLSNEVTDVLVKNCDLIHPNHTEINPNDTYYYYCGSLGILNGDDCDVHNIIYEDIRIEDPTAKLFSLKIMKTEWNRTDTYGKIRDIYFKNIQVIDGNFVPSEVLSFGIDNLFNGSKIKPGQLIENITFENLKILGKVISNAQEGGFIVCPATVNMRFIK